MNAGDAACTTGLSGAIYTQWKNDPNSRLGFPLPDGVTLGPMSPEQEALVKAQVWAFANNVAAGSGFSTYTFSSNGSTQLPDSAGTVLCGFSSVATRVLGLPAITTIGTGRAITIKRDVGSPTSILTVQTQPGEYFEGAPTSKYLFEGGSITLVSDLLTNATPTWRVIDHQVGQTAWYTFAGAGTTWGYQNSWGNWGDPTYGDGAWCLRGRLVQCRGLITHPAAGPGNTAMTFPPGARQGIRLMFAGFCSAGLARIDVDASGNLIPIQGGGSAGWLSLSNVQFTVEV